MVMLVRSSRVPVESRGSAHSSAGRLRPPPSPPRSVSHRRSSSVRLRPVSPKYAQKWGSSWSMAIDLPRSRSSPDQWNRKSTSPIMLVTRLRRASTVSVVGHPFSRMNVSAWLSTP